MEDKDTVVHFNQSMKAVCIENDSASKKDKSFLVGKQAHPRLLFTLSFLSSLLQPYNFSAFCK